MNEKEAVNGEEELPLSCSYSILFLFHAQEIKFLSSFQLIAHLSLEIGRIDSKFALDSWILSKK